MPVLQVGFEQFTSPHEVLNGVISADAHLVEVLLSIFISVKFNLFWHHNVLIVFELSSSLY